MVLEMLFEKNEMAVSRACDLRYLNERCLAILNLHVTPMSLTYCTGGDVICRILRPSWLQEYKKKCSDASSQFIQI